MGNPTLLTAEQLKELRENCLNLDRLRAMPDAFVAGVAAGSAYIVPPLQIPILVLSTLYGYGRSVNWHPAGPREEMCDAVDEFDRQMRARVVQSDDPNLPQKVFIPPQPVRSVNRSPQSVPVRTVTDNLNEITPDADAQAAILAAATANGVSNDQLNQNLQELIAWQHQSSDDQQKQLNRIENMQTLNSLGNFAGFLGQLGQMTHCPELQMFATAAQAGIQIASGISALGAASGVLACAGPIGIIGGGVMLLLNLFMKPGPDPTQLILDQIKKLEEKIDNLDKKILSHAIRNEKIQMEILRTSIEGIRLISQKIDRRFDSLEVKLQASLEDIKERLIFITAFTENAAVDGLARELVDTHNQVEQYLDGIYGEALLEGVQACSRTLIKWGNQKSHHPLITGMAVWQAKPSMNQTKEYFANMLQKNHINPSLGFIAAYAQEKYGTDFKASNVDIAKIANPEIWFQTVQDYVALNAEFIPADIDPYNRAVEQMRAVGECGSRFLTHIKTDQTLWTNLIKDYHRILQDVKKHANTYAAHYAKETLDDLNTHYRSNPVKLQNPIDSLDFIQTVDHFIQQFNDRKVNKLNGEIQTLGALREVCDAEQFLLTKTVFCERLHQINATALAAEFCKLLTFSAQQSAEISDYGIKKHVYLKAVEVFLPQYDRPIWTLPKGVKGRGGAAYVGEMDTSNLTTSQWQLPLQLNYQFEGQAAPKSYAKFQVEGKWTNFKGGVGCYIDSDHSDRNIHLINDTHYATCDYCSPAEVDKFKKQLTEHIRNYWLQRSADKPLTTPVFNQEADIAEVRAKLNDYFASHRQNIVYHLCKSGGPQHVAIKSFQDSLTQLDTLVMFMRTLAHLSGQDLENPALKSLLTSDKIVQDMMNFTQDKTLPAGWLATVEAALTTKLDQADLLNPQFAKQVPISQKLWEQGIAQLDFFKKWKILYKSRFPILSSHVNPEVYARQCSEAREQLFMHYTMDQFNDLKKKKFTSAKEDVISVNKNPLNETTADEFYRKSQRNILSWPLFRSRDVLVTQFKQSLPITELDAIPIGQYSKLYLQPYGWSSNIRSLMQYAAQFGGCRFPGIPFVEGSLQFNLEAESDRQFNNPANCSMFIEGTRAYLDLIVNNAELDNFAKHAGDSDAKRLENIKDLQQMGNHLKDILSCIATSSTLFETLFSRYENIINEPYTFIKEKLLESDKATVDKIKKALGDTPKRKDVFRLLASDVYQGARDKILDQLSSYAIWIRAYLEMGFGYDIKSRGENEIAFLDKPYTLYTSKEALLAYLQEKNQEDQLDVALTQYIKQIQDLKRQIVMRVAQANDLNAFRQHLLNRVPESGSALFIDNNCSPLPLTPQKVFLLSMFLSSCKVDEICLSNIEIDDTALVGLMQVLLHYPQIKSISLVNAHLSPNAYTILQFYLPMFPELTRLNLSGNRCELQHVHNLCNLVEVLPKLKALGLANCGLETLAISDLAVTLENHQHLTSLSLAGNCCESEEDVADIVSSLVTCPNLQKLSVGDEDLQQNADIKFADASTEFEIAPIAPTPIDISKAINYRLGQPALDQLLQELNQNAKALERPQSSTSALGFFAKNSAPQAQSPIEEKMAQPGI